ncbi:MAG: hypothetical protein A2Y62_17740 [Candidatus Fischerbacteria bacterium RBG_13_37_8]|uniref:Uncharacterized protein n=1 Tax=Candidatus Fischerbacteria bacterium RBG_13_37_8 TaxID=1817863 RepID=A0A1F5VP39_9BACT|nr:MAG: hypothetical protein A2Y62_17740 [Candidatus Fischerbacteria bacterium RBG_13_37_8]
MKKLLLTIVLITVCISFTYSQADYKIYGRVSDSKNNPIPKVKIILKNAENGREIHLETKADGTYEHMFIPHARYQVTFKKEGYRNVVADWDLSRWEEVQVEIKKDISMLTDNEFQEIQDTKLAQEEYNKAYESLTKNDCKNAVKHAQVVIKKFPKFPLSYFIAARCDAIEGKIDDAITNYNKVIELKPDLYEAFFDIAELYFQKDNAEKAAENFKKATELKQDDPEVFYNLGAIYFSKLKKMDEAQVNLEKALELKPDHGIAHKVLGYVLLNKGDIPGAVEHLKKYLEITPDAPDKKDIEALINSAQ